MFGHWVVEKTFVNLLAVVQAVSEHVSTFGAIRICLIPTKRVFPKNWLTTWFFLIFTYLVETFSAALATSMAVVHLSLADAAPDGVPAFLCCTMRMPPAFTIKTTKFKITTLKWIFITTNDLIECIHLVRHVYVPRQRKNVNYAVISSHLLGHVLP